jgi:hypothetical protein
VNLAGRLPDWSDSATPPEAYAALGPLAAEFMARDDHDRQVAVRSYSDAHCFPQFDLGPASGLYVFLRVVFDLPTDLPRDDALVFGGWLHPSVGVETDRFDLAWPVHVRGDDVLAVEGFAGYFGKGYDAVAEYDWLAGAFPRRDTDVLAAVRVLAPEP